MKKVNWKPIAYWITTILGPASFVIGGVAFLTHGEEPTTQFAHLGYPAYLMMILGVWKILGAVVIVLPGLPRIKEWAYAGFCFELIGAIASHAFVGDPLVASGSAQMLPALVFLALVLASWALRPASRRLGALGRPSF